MKLKGINPFEQHVDKAVLGLAGAAFLGVLGVQFLTSPNEVKVGNATLPPENAFQPAEEAAKQLDAQMRSDSPSLPEVPAQKDYAKLMSDRLAAGIAPRPTIKPLGTSIAFAAGAATQAIPTDLVLGELAMPAPIDVVAATHRAAIDPIDKVGIPGLAALLPTAQPYDKATVSIQGKFDGTSLKRLFETDPDGEGPQSALPLGWWRDNVEVIAVEVERERLESDGSWVEASVLPPVPGRVNLLPTWEQIKTADQATQNVITARSESPRVLRPSFYRIIAGPKWVEPMTAVAMVEKGADQTQIDRLKAELKKLDEEIPALQQQIDAMPKDERPAVRPPQEGAPAAGGGGGGRRGGMAGGGAQGGRNAPPPKANDANKPKPRWALEEQLRGKQGRRKIVVSKLKAAGVDVEAAPQPGIVEPAALVEPPLLDNMNVKFWAHDLTTQPGATYRYRTRMVLNNPVFGRALFLKDDQKAMAEHALVRGGWSDWSEEVAVDPDQAFFVTSATPQGDAALGQGIAKATAEVFKFYYGSYRRAAVGLEPGDMIALDMKLPAGLLIYDESKLPAARPEDAPAARNNPSDDPRAIPGNLGGGRRMGGPAGGAVPPPPPDAAPGAIAGLPPGDGKPGPEKIAFSSDLVLLGVAPGAAAELGGTEAMFRKADGLVIARLPEVERQSLAYKRFDSSARTAEDAAKPKTEQKDVNAPNAPRDPRAGR